MDGARKRISIVTPCLNEEEGIADCYRSVRRIFVERLPDYDYEHIFCDNASTDATVAILKGLAARDRRVKIIVNARNFGPMRSNFNGLLSARGDAVLVALPADLQDPPELIPEFVASWREGFEVVYGIRRWREEGRLLGTARKLYYRLVSRFAEVEIPVDVGEFQLVDRTIVEALRGFEDYYPYIRGMIASCGFRARGIAFTWRRRKKGVSKARLVGLIDQALNGLTSFSKLPVRLCTATGLVLSLLSISWALIGLAADLISRRRPASPGLTTLILLVLFVGGLQLFFMGLIGEYVAATHFQVRRRPLVIERERINFDLPGLKIDDRKESTVGSERDGAAVGLARGRRTRGSGRRRTRSLLGDQAVEDRADCHLIPQAELHLVHLAAVDAQPVAAPQVANQHPVVDQGQAAVAAGDSRQVDPDVAVGMPADQQDGPLQRDGRSGPRAQGDESGRHS
jgi:glycosyltransferase involved in cell wall biosynthesis